MSGFERYMEKEFRGSLEGERGVERLEALVEVLGYGKGFMRGRAIEEFLADNSGALEAIVEFIGEWSERNSDWDVALDEFVEEEEAE